ncbi:kinase-like protein [Rhizopus microsporus var. microsporus]|uniref:Kinase-like protein n=1 Tax=Rhizopus microsporus var. microsporus TaxID=86635 RepID=A0A1X0R6T6_RHIZD|nr:kinase-like protein [Rhizopus microsporus var. microsporus]
MSDISEYILECDLNFYRTYALPIIKNNPEMFDLDGFQSILHENENISLHRTIQEAFHEFELDKQSQYELNPRYGRYVWDMADQWYQKWSVVFSIEHMCNWVTSPSSKPTKVFDVTAWLTHTAKKYYIHPDHLKLLQHLSHYIADWHQSNRPLALRGVFKLNTVPFFPPTWFINKSRQSKSEGLAPSYLATFVPPYRLPDHQVPERWNQVFLKGITVQPDQKFNLDPILIHSTLHILGITTDYDEESQTSKLMFVMPKAKFGNLESHIDREIPKDYLKPCQLALSITKDVKDLHWNFIHGNIHPRNILLNYADYVGELVDITFMKRNNDKSNMAWAGRWPYVAPEVVSTGLSTSADIYALGIILWQLISRVTFPDDALVDPHIYRIEPIPDVLKEWQDIYIDCLHIDPSKRPNAYTLHRRLTTLCTKLKQSPVPLSDITTDYIKARRAEIDQFLSSYRKLSPQELYVSSPMPTSTSSTDSHTSTSSSNESRSTLYQVGDQVLTASVTRPSHQRLRSYPSLIQSFPSYT